MVVIRSQEKVTTWRKERYGEDISIEQMVGKCSAWNRTLYAKTK
jgi:hypothetical protein